MRKVLVGLCVFFVCAGLAAAQTKVDVQWKCAKPAAQHSVDVGDQPGHAFLISQFKCNATKGEMEGVKQKDGAGAQFDEGTGNAAKFHGIYVETLANGDKVNYSYEGSANMKGGAIVDASNKWWSTKGTGKFAGIKANGTCKGTGAADGSVTWDCAGTYTAGAAAPAKSAPKKKS